MAIFFNRSAFRGNNSCKWFKYLPTELKNFSLLLNGSVHDVQNDVLSNHGVNGSVSFTFNRQAVPDSDKSPSSVVAKITGIWSMDEFIE